MISLRKNYDATVKTNTQGGLERFMCSCAHCHRDQAGWHTWLLVQEM